MLAPGLVPPVAMRPEEVEPVLPMATFERARGRIGRAWEAVGAPRETARLPGELAALAEPGRALPEVGRGAAVIGPQVLPTGLGLQLPAGAPLETWRKAAPWATGALLGTLGAAWHDVKQMPWLGKPAKVVEALLKTGFETVLQAPVSAIEETIGRGITQRASGEYGLIPLSPGRHLTEQQKRMAGDIAEQRGMPTWIAQQGVLAAARLGTSSVRELALEQYGAGVETERMLGRLGLMGYSSYEAQVEGLHRLGAGEDIETVIGGRQIDTYEPSEEEKAAFKAYVAGVRAEDGDQAAQAAGQRVAETGVIPGSSDMGNEILFQMGLDPLNLLDIGVWRRGFEARRARAAGRFAEEAGQYADEVADGVKVALGHVDDGARAVGRADDADLVKALRGVWERMNPLAPTERAAAETAANTVYQVVTPGLMEVDSADGARAMVRALVEEPGRLVQGLGAVPVSEAAEEARPLLAAVAGKLDDFKSLRPGKFDRLAFLEELDGAVMDTALEIAGVGKKERGAYRQFVDGYRGLTGEFYLRTPGYAARNAMGDLVTMAWDGVLTLDGRGQIDDFLKRYGPTTRRMRGGYLAGRAGCRVCLGR